MANIKSAKKRILVNRTKAERKQVYQVWCEDRREEGLRSDRVRRQGCSADRAYRRYRYDRQGLHEGRIS